MKRLRIGNDVICIGIGLLLILLGAWIYYVFFPEVYFVKKIDEIIGKHYIDAFHYKKNIITVIIRNYLMDFLWSCSLTCFVSQIVGFGEKERKQCAILLTVFVIVMESIQILDGIPGTFDLLDIFVELCGVSVTLLMINKNKEGKKSEKN